MADELSKELLVGFFVSAAILATIVIGVPIINPVLKSLLGYTVPVRLDIIAYTVVVLLLVFVSLRFFTIKRDLTKGDWLAWLIPLLLLLVAFPIIFKYIPNESLSVVEPAFEYAREASQNAMLGVMNILGG